MNDFISQKIASMGRQCFYVPTFMLLDLDVGTYTQPYDQNLYHWGFGISICKIPPISMGFHQFFMS